MLHDIISFSYLYYNIWLYFKNLMLSVDILLALKRLYGAVMTNRFFRLMIKLSGKKK